MTLIMVDGFEDTSLLTRKYAWNQSTNSAASTVTSRPNSGNACRINGSGTTGANLLGYSIPSAKQHATLIFGFAFRVPSAVTGFPTSTNDPFIRLLGDTGTTTHINLTFATSSGGILTASRNTTSLGSSGTTYITGVWYYMEGKVVLNDSTGSVLIKVNGDTVINLTSQDTKNAGTGSVFDTFAFGVRANAAATIDFDDMYLANNDAAGVTDFLGDCQVETLRPSGDGNYSQFTGSDGNSTNNSLLVDEAALDIADYVQAAAGNKDTYAYGNLTASSPTIKGVQAQAVAIKTASSAQSFKQDTRISSTDYQGSSQALSTSDVPYQQIWEVSPATSSAWTGSEVNGAEFGVEAV